MSEPTVLADVVRVADEVAGTTKRNAKRDALAALIADLAPDEVPIVVGFLTGEVRQGRIGIGWATIRDLTVEPAAEPSLTVREIDAEIDALAATTGPGSQARRRQRLEALFGRATAAEGSFLGRLFVGEMRQGALAGVVTDAVAVAAGVPQALMRRAAMLRGDLGATATIAATEGEAGLRRVGLTVLRAVEPMLASTAESTDAALAELGTASVEWKLDGARIQVHRAGDDVRIFTRNLNDVTARLPEVVETVRSFPSDAFVLDGEILGFFGPDAEGPEAFQDTMSRFGREDASSHGASLVPWFFDVLHVGDRDLIDTPLRDRRERLAQLVGERLVPGALTDDPETAAATLTEALEAGHEGVMVKGADSRYEAGRRGKAWRKVKPVHTLDLVVLGVEWGSGRRRGWLSNIHLGALDPASGEPVMVGKTFKGMTDELLRWQTERFTGLKTAEQGHVVWVRPEQVVEIALDGAQTSTRYPGGVALRFARVVRYRDDKPAEEADTLDAVRALLPRARRARS